MEKLISWVKPLRLSERVKSLDLDPSSVNKSISRQHYRSIRLLVFCGLGLIAAIIACTTLVVFNFRDRALTNSERELANSALFIARHLDLALEELSLVEKDIDENIRSRGIASSDELERYVANQDKHLLLRASVSALPHVSRISLINADGKLINSSTSWPVPAISIADREYFEALKSDPRLLIYVNKPVRSRIAGTQVILAVRKLTAKNGEFLGVVVGAIESDYFQRFFESVLLRESETITLFRPDGIMLLRYPYIESSIGKKYRGTVNAVGDDRDAGTTHVVFQTDGKEHLTAAHRVFSFPLIVSVGVETEVALADWWKETQFLISVAAVSTVLIGLVLWLILRQLLRGYRWSQQKIAEDKQQLDNAVNNMTQALLLFDSAERIVVCNQRYIDMYGLSPYVVKPGCTFTDLIRHRKETGSFTGDVDAYRASLLRDLTKGYPTELMINTTDGRVIRIINKSLPTGGWVATHEDMTERVRIEEQVVHLAYHDVLTDLPNRLMFRQRLEEALKRVPRGEQVAVLYLDLDNFKKVNDTLGHSIGDELLKVMAGRLRDCVREVDVVARLGGDEFAIIQSAVERPADVAHLAKRVLEVFREPCDCCGKQLAADASIGIAIAPNNATDPDQLLKNADLAMYGAKADGRGTYRFFELHMDAAAKARHAMEDDLRQAIVHGELELHYQPLVNLEENRITACEALLRWKHPQRGMVSPAEFIPLAEETGLIVPLGEWVLNTACAAAVTWPAHISVSVNVSPVQFKRSSFGLSVVRALGASGLLPSRLELELTEAVLIRNDEVVLNTLNQLRELGLRIVMDDFGVGYSSLGYLRRFPFDKVKIDRSFIKSVMEDACSRAIVQAVVSITRSLGLPTVAEGVETEEQLQLVHRLGCTEAQGYLFGKAIPAADILRLLSPHSEKAVAVA
jgi:diguanylate cyclase (GGDEF)-like protein